jgi:hypothetical protein
MNLRAIGPLDDLLKIEHRPALPRADLHGQFVGREDAVLVEDLEGRGCLLRRGGQRGVGVAGQSEDARERVVHADRPAGRILGDAHADGQHIEERAHLLEAPRQLSR